MRKFLTLSFLVLSTAVLAGDFSSSQNSSRAAEPFAVDGLQTECSSNTGQCPGVGWFCLNGQCVQENTGERCWNNVDCPIGSQCVNGVCK